MPGSGSSSQSARGRCTIGLREGRTTVGLDLAKYIFQLHGADSAGAVVFRKKLRRGQLLAFLATLPPCTVAMEACGSAHELAFLGIASSPAFVRAPEGNGCAERFIRTLKENLLWVRTFDTVEELRQALLDFRESYNTTWLIERHGFQTPAAVRQNQLSTAARAA